MADELFKYRKSNSPFVRVGKTVDSDIFEQDYYTIVKEPLPGSGIEIRGTNFKVLVDQSESAVKKYNNKRIKVEGYKGITNEDESNSDLYNVPIIPKKYSIADFAYYGSAVDLINASINDIIARFPGAIFWPDENSPRVKIKVGDTETEYYEISNDFDIDCWSEIPILENPMRSLSLSKENYIFHELDNTTGTPIDLIIKDAYDNLIKFDKNNICPNTIIGRTNLCFFSDNVSKNLLWLYCDEDYKIHLLVPATKLNGTYSYLCGRPIVEPKQEVINEFWASLNDFEKVLLNRSTVPLYRADFDYQSRDENGFHLETKKYVWPRVFDSYSLDISSSMFGKYLGDLIDMATFYDEYDSDNIWRMMVHESIKNLDNTIITRDGTSTDFSLDTTRIKSIIEIYGRAFDDLRRDIDDINNRKTVTYSGKDSVPLEDLKETLIEKGWSALDITPSRDISGRTVICSDIPYSGVSVGLTPSKVNEEFMRRLALNSRYIHSLKGTRNGIKAILGMFGYEEVQNSATSGAGTYYIGEYVNVVNSDGYVTSDDFSSLRCEIGNYQVGENTDVTIGYPVAEVPVVPPVVDNNEVPVVDNNDLYYMIPWVNPNKTYDNEMYFQSKGGWGKMASKKLIIDGNSIWLSASTATSIYDETVPRLFFAKNETDLAYLGYTNTLDNNTICYVAEPSPGLSNYFILKNKNNYTLVNNDNGWKNVEVPETINSGTTISEELKKVILCESILFDNEGNNPHNMSLKYDDGEDYLDNFRKLFKKSIDNSVAIFNCNGDCATLDDLADFGFKFTRFTDNKKCHYFDLFRRGGMASINENWGNVWADSIYSNASVFSGETNIQNSNAKCSEIGANSVVNVKNLTINFGVGGNTYLKDYIQNIVLGYLKLMLPSTTIVEYTFDGVAIPKENEVVAGNVQRRSIIAAQGILDDNAEDSWMVDEGNNIVNLDYIIDDGTIDNN